MTMFVSPASLVFLSGRLVLLPLQAERRKRCESTVACREGGKASTNTGKGLELHGELHVVLQDHPLVCGTFLCAAVTSSSGANEGG